MNRNALFAGGIRAAPLLPAGAEDRGATAPPCSRRSPAADPRFFLGTDSAPHARRAKEAACGCAGIFSAHAGIELYAEAFEAAGALDQLEAFAALNGADFYGLPRNEATDHPHPGRVATCRRAYPFGADELVPLRAGESLAWRLAA